MEIRAEKSLYAVNVYIDDLPHLHLKLEGFRGMQSYVDGFTGQDAKWCVELYYLGMEPILVEYNSAEKWRKVLEALAPYLK